MKYKVGDRVRLKNGLVCTISSYYAELGCQFPDAFICKGEYGGKDIAPVRLKDISHLVISDITDEMINRFKKEKIAWHFKNKEDYSKMLYLLSNKGIGFHFAVDSPEEFFDKKKDFCLTFYSLKLHLQYGGLDGYVKDGYEIIEIMNPFRIRKYPSKLKGLNTHCSMITALQEEIEIMQKEIDRLSEIIEKQKRIVKMTGNGLMELSKVLIEKQEEIK